MGFVLQMTFLEFFEALIGCAEVFGTEAVVKDPTTPRPSTVMTPEQSMFSIPVSRSRLDSQVILTFELIFVILHLLIMYVSTLICLVGQINVFYGSSTPLEKVFQNM